jgi:hypothetical protein
MKPPLQLIHGLEVKLVSNTNGSLWIRTRTCANAIRTMVRAIASTKFGTSIVSEKLGINCFIVFNMIIRKKKKNKGNLF